MTMIENEFYCVHCQRNVPHKHFCNPEAENERFTCEYCGAENVTHKHLCREKLKHVKYYCANCGTVAVSELDVCNPHPLLEYQEVEFKRVAEETTGEILHCNVCGQPVTPPGHFCDRKIPYDCPYCGEKGITAQNHVCKPMIGKFKFVCKNCGRLGIKETDVCAPSPLP